MHGSGPTYESSDRARGVEVKRKVGNDGKNHAHPTEILRGEGMMSAGEATDASN